MEEKKLFLLDAYALIYRAYYAMMRSPRFTSKGLNTSAIFGFCNTLEDVIRKENPGYMAVCFDPPGGHTFRHEAYPEYKAQRDKQPEDITLAIPYIKRILEAYRIPVVEVDGFEADDVIGTLSRMAEHDGFTTYMMTPDKDYGQLVTPSVYMYRPALKGQGFEIRGVAEVCERYGISRPSQVIDLLALEGDASDNIPGCPGVGEKTASKLIAAWDTVENLIANTANIKGALRAKIEENAEQIIFSKYLVTIRTDVPLGCVPEDFKRQEPDVKALLGVFGELEFRSFAAKYKLPEETPARPPVGSLFDFEDETTGSVASESPAVELPPLTMTDGIGSAVAVVERALESSVVGVCVNAVGEDAMSARILGLALAVGDETAYIAFDDFGGPDGQLVEALRKLFSNKSTLLVSHDVKRDMVALSRLGINWTAPWFDTSVAHYLLSPESQHELWSVAFAVLHIKTLDYDMTSVQRKKAAERDESLAAPLCGERAALALRLRGPLEKLVAESGLGDLLAKIELPFVAVLASMEEVGVRIDVKELYNLRSTLTRRLSELETQAFAIAGSPFNVGSPAQVGDILFERLKIDDKAKKTKTGAWSTTEEILEKYAKDHPIVRLILDIRGLRKLLTTYVEALPRMINPRTGKIHTTFNQTVTATGRISSTNPNLQNIPVRTEDGREIRRAFVADPGDLILSADYSQIELRLMAAISGDPEMIEAFANGDDIHRITAAKIYHVSPEEVTDAQRRNAKTANFGIIYGISAFGLSERLGIPRAEAKQLIDGYMATYPTVGEYMKKVVESARENGYVATLYGRKRFLPEIGSRNAALRGYAERNAVNAPLQGTAADIIKIAMIDIDAEIRRRGLRSRMIMQVHDELIFNVKPEELAEMQTLVTSLMEHAFSGKVTLEVSSGVGSNWLEAH